MELSVLLRIGVAPETVIFISTPCRILVHCLYMRWYLGKINRTKVFQTKRQYQMAQNNVDTSGTDVTIAIITGFPTSDKINLAKTVG